MARTDYSTRYHLLKPSRRVSWMSRKKSLNRLAKKVSWMDPESEMDKKEWMKVLNTGNVPPKAVEPK
jgi:hypothetical protein